MTDWGKREIEADKVASAAGGRYFPPEDQRKTREPDEDQQQQSDYYCVQMSNTHRKCQAIGI